MNNLSGETQAASASDAEWQKITFTLNSYLRDGKRVVFIESNNNTGTAWACRIPEYATVHDFFHGLHWKNPRSAESASGIFSTESVMREHRWPGDEKPSNIDDGIRIIKALEPTIEYAQWIYENESDEAVTNASRRACIQYFDLAAKLATTEVRIP